MSRPHPPIRSFVLRSGRITPAQVHAWDTQWPRFGIEFGGAPIDLDARFGRQARRVLEIGFGNGAVLSQLAQEDAGSDFLGIEVHRAGVGRLLLSCAAAELSNVRIVCHDAVEVLRAGIGPETFDEVLIFFPDPWHKKRHHKRRLIDVEFLNLIATRLRKSGVLRIATDWADYAKAIRAAADATAALESLADASGFAPRFSGRPLTRFEARGHRLGHDVWDFAFSKAG